MTIKSIKKIVTYTSIITLFIIAFIMFSPKITSNTRNINQNSKIQPFSLSNNAITYNTKVPNPCMPDVLKQKILNRAKAMTEVKWIPMHNLVEKKCSYIFIKGKTYRGVPYSMDLYQVSSPSNFLSKISKSKILYGNDCSSLVSTAWGINRQTTLSLYNHVRSGSKIGKNLVCQVSWNDLKPTDALLLDNGKGKGHIMLYINSDKENSDNLNVYEQNISTVVPFEPIPVARKDVRSKSKLIKKGYIPIRLIAIT
ncbi:hypothetical protein KPL37_13205 [Clostridium frigoris]|uniref:NlpC/P60 domain-containing protein n=1 Tax=Clostridium frigoris TaxID=205327 RepID=A0ABS6BUV9_9CLOT|nr:hypothetical protein [Clostridium frigoris]MBU3160703.1 hypothetical protein [Clostridium frigoris]